MGRHGLRLRLVTLTMFLLGARALSAQPSYAAPNDLPNPYLPGVSWGTLPDARKWGATGGVDIAPDGTIWAYDRCGGNQNGCADSSLPAILHFDRSGRVIKAFGAGMFNFPHGISVDREGNVWVTDHGMQPPNGKGDAVYKFSPEGTLLLTLGTPGLAGTDNAHFTQPSDVLVAPNGDIFIADGHTPGPVARIVKFDRTGKFIKTWGSRGPADTQLNGPHALAMDSAGRLFVGDRTNNRIQIFDQEGALLASWKQFGRPSGMFIDRNDVLYVTDSESRSDRENAPGGYGYNPDVKRGIRIGSVKDGKVTAFVPDPRPQGASSMGEGIAADEGGNLYGAEVGPRDMKKYVKAPPSQTTLTGTAGPITITAMTHASVQIEYSGKVIQIDPAMGDLERAKIADLLLVTDVHDDHMNISRLQKLRKPGAPIVVPAAVRTDAGSELATPVEVFANGQTRTVAGFAIQAIPAYNIEHKMGDEPFHTKGRGNGYVVTVGGKRIFVAGDTECVPEIKALRNIDAALLPMNLPFTMSPADAAACAKAFKPGVLIPYHFSGSNPSEVETGLKGSGIDVRMLNWYPTIERPDVIAIARPGKLVDLGGRSLHLHCTGRGTPTVLLDAGMMGFALDWSLVQSAIEQTNRVCSYDGPGRGWSDPHPHPDAVSAATTDFHAALVAAGEKAPYVFVGAGSGAIDARVFHQRFPNEVRGFVFVDGIHEDMAIVPIEGKPTPMWSVSAEQLKTALAQMRPPPGASAPPPPPPPPPSTDAPYDTLPKDVLTTRVTFQMRFFRAQRSGPDEEEASMESDRATFAALHAAGVPARPLGDLPLVVVKGALGGPPPAFAFDDKLAALSTNATKRVIARSGPEVHLYDPAAVTMAIQDVAEASVTRAPVRTR